MSNPDVQWETPGYSDLFARLGSFSRLIRFDAAGSKRAALFGISESAPMSLLFAATYPERARALVLYGSFARHPTFTDKAVLQRNLEEIESGARERLPVISVLHGFLRNQAPRSGIYEMDTAAGGAMHALVVAHAIARLLVCLELPVDHKAGRGASEKNRFCHAWTMPVGVDVGFALDQDVIGLVT